MHEIYQAGRHVLHIQETDGTFFSIIHGDKLAIISDTAYGIGDNRGFIEAHINTPYIVINTHGHADHVQGDWQFDEAWMHPADQPAYERACSRIQRISTFYQYAASCGVPRERKAAYIAAPRTVIHPLQGNERFDLGGVHVSVHHFPGHTRGEIGLLVEEDRLLLSGDSFSDDCFMFWDNHDTLEALQESLKKALHLPFDTYLGSHTTKALPREFLSTVLENAEKQEIVPGSEEVILGVKTLTIQAEGPLGISKIRIPDV